MHQPPHHAARHGLAVLPRLLGCPRASAAPDGTPVNAVRGLLDFVARLVTDYSPSDLVACWDDDWRPEFRVALLPGTRRSGWPLRAGRRGCARHIGSPGADHRRAAGGPGHRRVGTPGFEADDVIGTLTERASGPTQNRHGDRDLFQLVDDSRGVAVLHRVPGVSRAELVDSDWLVRRYDIPPGTYGDYSILRGDPSDGLPGVRGVGERTAATLLRDFGSLAAVRAAAADPGSALRPALRSKITAASDYLDRAAQVVSVVRTCPGTSPHHCRPGRATRPGRTCRTGGAMGSGVIGGQGYCGHGEGGHVTRGVAANDSLLTDLALARGPLHSDAMRDDPQWLARRSRPVPKRSPSAATGSPQRPRPARWAGGRWQRNRAEHPCCSTPAAPGAERRPAPG